MRLICSRGHRIDTNDINSPYRKLRVDDRCPHSVDNVTVAKGTVGLVCGRVLQRNLIVVEDTIYYSNQVISSSDEIDLENLDLMDILFGCFATMPRDYGRYKKKPKVKIQYGEGFFQMEIIKDEDSKNQG